MRLMRQRNSPSNEFGIYVGRQLRQARKLRELSQEGLANSLKSPITFQQIQKYENMRRVKTKSHYLDLPK